MQINILDYLDNAAVKYGNRIAYSDGTDEMSFMDVQEKSRAIGSYLASIGLRKQPVAVFMRRHPTTIAAFYGVITAGCYYVPLDEEMPAYRIELILKNVEPEIIICDDYTFSVAENFSGSSKLLKYEDLVRSEYHLELLSEIRSSSIDTDLLYIVFTSGSTGIPKGVAACHRNVIDYIEQLTEILKVDETTVFGNQTPLYLDACLKELIPVLKKGAKAYIIPKQLFLFPLKLVEYINEHQINTVCWVVTALTMISGLKVLEKSIPSSLHTIAFASEVFPIRQFNLWRQALPDARFINFYGPTEATGVCCFYEVNREFNDGDIIPIGKPFANREIFLINEDGTKAVEGAVGEIYIRGSSLTHGYYGDFARTAEAFVQNPLNSKYPEIVYKTGDLGRFDENGILYFVSRKDYQIKHMGQRIELGEIEAAAASYEDSELVGCIYDKDKKRIVLFYTGKQDNVLLKKQLAEKLPRYMIPARIIHLSDMPLTANKKIDRNELFKIYDNGGK